MTAHRRHELAGNRPPAPKAAWTRTGKSPPLSLGNWGRRSVYVAPAVREDVQDLIFELRPPIGSPIGSRGRGALRRLAPKLS